MAIYELDGQAPELPPEGQYWVAPEAILIGRVRLAPGASVWFGAVLRGDNEWISIGPDSNVQEHCMLHTDPGFPLDVGGGCTIGHGVILHGCAIGEGALIGMGATVLNGARIGAGCLVGAGALVTEGKQFEDGALIVGSPARAVRTMSPDQIAQMRKGAAGYARRWPIYASRLKRIG